jgi:hypothetical protein
VIVFLLTVRWRVNAALLMIPNDFELMGDLRGEPACRFELLLAQRMFARLLVGPAKLVEENLHPIAADCHQQKHRQAQHKGFAAGIEALLMANSTFSSSNPASQLLMRISAEPAKA